MLENSKVMNAIYNAITDLDNFQFSRELPLTFATFCLGAFESIRRSDIFLLSIKSRVLYCNIGSTQS